MESRKIFRVIERNQAKTKTSAGKQTEVNKGSSNSNNSNSLPQGSQVSLVDLITIDSEALENCVFMQATDGKFDWQMTDEMMSLMSNQDFRFVQISKSVYTRKGK